LIEDMNISGKILEIFETQQINDTFKKREFVVEYAENPQYPEFIKFETIQSNCDQLDNLNAGDQVNIQFNLKGRKWTDPQGNVKYFNSLQAWRIEGGTSQQSTPSQESTPTNDSQDWMGQSFSEDDDLPF
jgi:single-stranded DNA-binding protein